MASLTTTWVGQTLEGGRFLVGEKLGEGGMAVVFRADDLAEKVSVVIKVPKQTALENTTFLKRFAAENRALMKLRHPFIVSILHVGEQEGWPFTVLQYLPGGDLDEFRAKIHETESLQSLGQWLPRIAEALDFIHGQGYVHRDVKPANILFDGEGQVVLSDFGIAKALSQNTGQTSHLTATGMVLGTPDYMAPELIMGRPIDGKVDQYALGTIVYEWLTGRVPFRAATPAAVLVKQTTVRAKPVSELNPAIPEEVSQIVMRALAKNPDHRFASCGEFCRTLLDAVQIVTTPKGKPPTSRSMASQTQSLTAHDHSSIRRASGETPMPSGEKSSETRPPKPPTGKRPRPEPRPEPVPQPAASSGMTRKKATYQLPVAIGLASSLLCLILLVVLSQSTPDENARKTAKTLGPESTKESEATPSQSPEEVVGSSDVPETILPEPSTESREMASLPSQFVLPTALVTSEDPKAGEERKDNSLLLEFCYCPPGSFLMGSPPTERERRGNEDPQPVLLTQGFWLDKTEVTQGQWRTVMGSAPWQGQPNITEGDNSAASVISWDDAMAFCEKLTEQERHAGRLPEGWTYTLPTEAQWEYACRAGTTTRYFFGDDPSRLEEFAWVLKDPFNHALKQAQEVGKKSPNPWGLRDMHGNVYEWCRDWYHEKLPGGIDPLVTQPARFRVFRGGAYDFDYRHAFSASRSGNLPDYRAPTVGFRPALVPGDDE